MRPAAQPVPLPPEKVAKVNVAPADVMRDTELQAFIAENERAQEQEADDSIDDFKQSLAISSVPGVEGNEIRIRYAGDANYRDVEVRQILVGNGDFYLDCWWPERNDTRLFKAQRIENILTAAGGSFDNAYYWIASTGPAGKQLAFNLGWEV